MGLALGCGDDADARANIVLSQTTPIANALEQLKERPNVSDIEIRHHVDGRLGLVTGYFRSEVAIVGYKFGIASDGLIRNRSEAVDMFHTEHALEWGCLTVDQVPNILLLPPGVPTAFAAWIDEGNPNAGFGAVYELDPEAECALDVGVCGLSITPEEAVALARMPGLRGLDHLTPSNGPTEEVANSGNSAADYASTKTTFNALGYFGLNVPIGLDEESFRCAYDMGHEAFHGIPLQKVTYRQLPVGCSLDVDCYSECGTQAKCLAGSCRISSASSSIYLHAFRVMSRMSSSSSSAWLHAARSRFFLANGHRRANSMPPTPVEVMDYNGALAWVTGNVRIVNQSWLLDGIGYGEFDKLVDTYAYNTRVLFVKAAGNDGAEPVTCDSQASICVGSMNANGTYGTSAYGNDTRAPTSSYRNPVAAAGGASRNIEKPDLVAEGMNALVAVAGVNSGASAWTTDSGTSFAAPVVSGIAALLYSKCIAKGFGPLQPEHARALLRNFAITPQTYEKAFTPSPFFYKPGTVTAGVDYRFGLGVIDAGALEYFSCNPSPPPAPPPGGHWPSRSVGGSGVLHGSGWTAVPSWVAESGFDPGDHPHTKYLKAGLQWKSLASFKVPIGQGSRLRASLSVSPCPTKIPQDGLPAIDYDLLAVSVPDQKLVAISESTEDANEGFDVQTTSALQEVEFFALRPANAVACQRSGVDFEPYGFSGLGWF
ncbi:MAG: S8 family serine peptidase [Deltaproteobacteria bacterium]|nr:S8 family serine peptidase [Deltaproteobacteria bacterium]